MRARWIQVPPGRRETATALAAAGVLATAAGAATFWLVRTLLSREALDEPVGRREELAERSAGSP
jgi:hypothetical protein